VKVRTALAARATLAVLWVSFLLSGCVFYPKANVNYAADCEATSRRLVLEAKQLGECTGPDAAACIGSALLASAGSAIVSGSIVVVGNTVYWLEKKVQCMGEHGAKA
jgi:hypothetical protein